MRATSLCQANNHVSSLPFQSSALIIQVLMIFLLVFLFLFCRICCLRLTHLIFAPCSQTFASLQGLLRWQSVTLVATSTNSLTPQGLFKNSICSLPRQHSGSISADCSQFATLAIFHVSSQSASFFSAFFCCMSSATNPCHCSDAGYLQMLQ